MKTFTKNSKSTARECKWPVEDIRYTAFSNLLIDFPKKRPPLIIRKALVPAVWLGFRWENTFTASTIAFEEVDPIDYTVVRWSRRFESRPVQPLLWIVDCVICVSCPLSDPPNIHGLTYSSAHCPVFGAHRQQLGPHVSILCHRRRWTCLRKNPRSLTKEVDVGIADTYGVWPENQDAGLPRFFDYPPFKCFSVDTGFCETRCN